MEQDERYARAKKRVAELRSFYSHLTVYVVIMAVLFFVDLRDGGNWWFYWPLMGWGIAVVFHALGTFGFGKRWEERKIKEIMEKEKEQEQ